MDKTKQAVYCPDCGYTKTVPAGHGLKTATEHNRKCRDQQVWKRFLYGEFDEIEKD